MGFVGQLDTQTDIESGHEAKRGCCTHRVVAIGTLLSIQNKLASLQCNLEFVLSEWAGAIPCNAAGHRNWTVNGALSRGTPLHPPQVQATLTTNALPLEKHRQKQKSMLSGHCLKKQRLLLGVPTSLEAVGFTSLVASHNFTLQVIHAPSALLARSLTLAGPMLTRLVYSRAECTRTTYHSPWTPA